MGVSLLGNGGSGRGWGVAGIISWGARQMASAGIDMVLSLGVGSYLDSMSVGFPLLPKWEKSSAFTVVGG